MFGYVKHYLPPHAEARHRIDVGRRSVRAIVVFTRRDGVQHSGDSFVYPNLLYCLEQLMLYTDYAGNLNHKVQTLLNELHDRDLLSSKSGSNSNFAFDATPSRTLSLHMWNFDEIFGLSETTGNGNLPLGTIGQKCLTSLWSGN